MTKLTREQKIEIYEKRTRKHLSIISLQKEYKITTPKINYLIRLIDMHGYNVLRKDKNNYYSPLLKEEIINKVLINKQSINTTAIEYGLPSDSLLHSWIRSYKENGYVIVEKTRGRSPTMKTKSTKEYKDMTTDEKVKYLENRNLYLEAENDCLKKLRAVVQARKNQQPKKK